MYGCASQYGSRGFPAMLNGPPMGRIRRGRREQESEHASTTQTTVGEGGCFPLKSERWWRAADGGAIQNQCEHGNCASLNP